MIVPFLFILFGSVNDTFSQKSSEHTIEDQKPKKLKHITYKELQELYIIDDTEPGVYYPKSTDHLKARNILRNASIYIDGVKIKLDSTTVFDENIMIITGGIPGTYGDLKGPIILPDNL